MNMTVDVIFRFDPALDRVEEVDAAGPDPGAAEVPEPERGSVAHQHVRVGRDLTPAVEAGRPPRQVERPAAELRLPGRACTPVVQQSAFSVDVC